MGDFSLRRMSVRVAVQKANMFIITSVAILGLLLGLMIVSSILTFVYSPYFVLPIILLMGLFKYVLYRMEKLAFSCRKLQDAAYPSDDKQHVWDVERTRDKMLARMIIEGVCPWSSNSECNIATCASQKCHCRAQMKNLIELGYIDDKKEKVVLDDSDGFT